jgi:peroxiredoxin
VKPSVVAQFAFILVAALAVYLFVVAAQDGEARASCTALCALHPAYANRDRSAPDFELSDLDGRKVKLSSFRGQTVVLNFWTKTCRPCLEEMASVEELSDVLRAQGDATLVAVSTDSSADDARATLKAILGHEPPFTVLVDPESNVVNGKFGTRLFPETWVIDPHGVIRARVDGARDWSNPFVLEVVKMVARPEGCGITFEAGKSHGDRREVCGEVAPSE